MPLGKGRVGQEPLWQADACSLLAGKVDSDGKLLAALSKPTSPSK